MREGYVPECFRATFFILIKLLVKVHRASYQQSTGIVYLISLFIQNISPSLIGSNPPANSS